MVDGRRVPALQLRHSAAKDVLTQSMNTGRSSSCLQLRACPLAGRAFGISPVFRATTLSKCGSDMRAGYTAEMVHYETKAGPEEDWGASHRS